MAKTKEQKKEMIENLREKIARQKTMVFLGFEGLKIKDLSDLRNKLKSAGSQLVVVKKTLMNSVFKEKKIKVDFGKAGGQLALVFGFQDELAPSKITYQFSQANQNIKILGGFFEGKLRDAEEIIDLAQIPSKEELLVKLVSSLSAPISNLVNVLEANIKGLVYALSAIKK